jgi:hypothetical protein
MLRFRQFAPLGALCALGACVAAPPPGYVAAPGQGKDAAAFQQDDAACHKEAEAASGQAPAGSANATTTRPDAGSLYAQCMTAKGDTVTRASYPAYPAYAYAYPYPYPYGYPYAYPYYPYAYPAVVGGPVVSFGFGFCCGGHHGFYHR